MRKVACVALAALALTGCASTGRMMSYGGKGMDSVADAKFQSGGREYALWVHRQEDMIMLQRGVMTAAGKSFVQGLTWGLVEARDPYIAWKQAATEFLAPVGCTATEVRPIDQDTAWEAAYVCPEGVDLRALVAAQKAQLRKGQPLTK